MIRPGSCNNEFSPTPSDGTGYCNMKGLDVNIIKSESIRRKKLLLADMDSTIIKEESLDELAKLIGKEKEIIQITKEAMKGKIDFKTAYTISSSASSILELDWADSLKSNA